MPHVPEHVLAAYESAFPSAHEQREVFASLSDADLVAAARAWLHECCGSRPFQPSNIMTEAALWHLIIPELLRRLTPNDCNNP